MKIIVCGAGSVGRSIVSYLIKGNNDIIVIDNNQKALDDLAQEFDILPVLGSASHPEVLEKADAAKARLLIAATNVDEVNMVACQVAHSVFNVPRKIARIDAQDFLEPLWATLYNEKSLPIDLIISPEIEIGKYIYHMLKIPGASEVLPLFDGKMQLLGFKMPEESPLIKVPLLNLGQVSEDINVEVVCVNRRGNIFIPYRNDMLETGDEVFLLTPDDKVEETIAAFGIERPAVERVIIFGGNKISRYMGKLFEKDDNIISCKIIEEDLQAARNLAKDLNNTVVIHGPLMSDKILSEAGIGNTDAAIAVTMQDNDNLLATMLAEKSGVNTTVALVNSPSYNNLIGLIGNSILVDRTSVTISGILQELRKADVKNAYSLGRGLGEIWEMEISDGSPIAGKTVRAADFPASSKICACLRNEEISYLGETDVLQAGDKVIIYVDSAAIRKVEKIIS